MLSQMRDVEDVLRDIQAGSRSSGPGTGITDEIESFLGRMQDATCYHVVAPDILAFRCWLYQFQSNGSLVWDSTAMRSAWTALLDHIQYRTAQSPDGSALVSLVLCPPSSLVFRDLAAGSAYLNLRSGSTWDLHLIGYTALESGTARPNVLGVPLWRFSAARFLDVVAHVQREHAAVLAAPGPVPVRRWRYSGTADLVSVMAYRDLPGLIDWSSLRAVQLLGAQGQYLDRSIGQITEIMSDWREDRGELRDMAPGELQQNAISVLDLRRALTLAANMIASGIIGNAAYELLTKLLH
jgi:hypothetical protein